MRYRITTPQVLHQEFFDDSDRNAVTKVTSRLCALEFLTSHPLYGSNVYFTLGKKGARVFGVAARRVTKPLGPQALYREYGTLAFCRLGPIRRERLRVAEIANQFPSIAARRIDSSHYYLDHDGTVARLGYIWVETGGPVDHIVRTVCNEIIEDRRSVPTLKEYIDQSRFVATIVTMTEDKRDAIIAALRNVTGPALFRIEAVPELIHLLPSKRHG